MSYSDASKTDFRNSPHEPPRGVSWWAVGSLLTAIVSPVFFCFCVPTILASLSAVVMGHIALFSIWGSEGRRSGTPFALGGLIIGYPVLLISGVMAPFYFSAIMEANDPSTPRGALNLLEEQITSDRKGTFHGNNEEAKEMAKEFSEVMGDMRDVLLGEQEVSELSLTKGEFVTYCELQHDRCLFLVHVPDYRNYKPEAKELVANLAWSTAMLAAREKLPAGAKLGVGLRGIIQYGAVMTGEIVGPEVEEVLDARETNTTDSDDLFPFVQPKVEQELPADVE
ncbi:MAG: DUF4190 domain-containing protein [bacterium]|nr:DUF4190 domain-containing protein [bacterium]